MLQCDQTTVLCFQYLDIFSNENLPQSIQIVPKWAENFAQNQKTLNLLPKIFKYWSKRWNFAKLGHTDLLQRNNALWLVKNSHVT